MGRYRTARKTRYEKLVDRGFLEVEARALSKVPLSVPYMKALVNQRNKQHKKAISEGSSELQWKKTIKADYAKHNYDEYGTMGNKSLRKFDSSAVWRMLRDFEDKYKDKHPSYKSPWIPRQKAHNDFLSKYKYTMGIN